MPRKDCGESIFSSTNSQLFLRRTDLVNTCQIPRENVSIGIDRKYNVPRVFTKAKRGDFRSYYQKFMKTNLSGPAYEKYGKYVVTRIIDLIKFCIEKQIKVNNSDIEEKLQSLSINEIFFGSRNKDIYLQLVDMIYNSIHLSLSGIPIQRTIKPGKKNPRGLEIFLQKKNKFYQMSIFMIDMNIILMIAQMSILQMKYWILSKKNF